MKQLKKLKHNLEKIQFIIFHQEIDKNIEIMKSWNLNIDKALGIGGFPKGRIIEIYK